MILPKPAGSLIFPSMRTSCSVGPCTILPAGTSMLAAWIARITSSTPTLCDCICAGRRLMSTWRATPPEVRTWPTPGTFWKRFTITWSVSVVSSRSVRVGEVTASDTTGCALSKSPRGMSGSFTSRGRPGRISAIWSRTSWTPRDMSVSSRNSMSVSPRPSQALERITFTPLTVLTTSSTGLLMSFSTASGEAPGYWNWMKTNGTVMSGMRSTRRRLYENRPRTHNATITMVAKTGWLMLVLVIHMAKLLAGLAGRGDRGLDLGGLHHGGVSGLQARDARAHDTHPLLQTALHFDHAALRLRRAQLDGALADLAGLDRDD